MLLKDVCTTDVVCCGAQTHALEAARIMRQKHVGDLVVVDDLEDRRPLGLVTDRDLVVAVMGNGLDSHATLVTSVMQTPVVIASETEDTSAVIERMRAHGVRRLPVVNEHGATVGIITLNDLLASVIEQAGRLLQVMVKGQDSERRSRR